MLFLSDRMTSASGSIGGTTFSHNSSGMYVRARRVPVNPNSLAQQRARAALTAASSAWRLLTAAQRAAWAALASPRRNRLGAPIVLSGLQAYVASNSFLIQIGTAPVSDPPPAGALPLGFPTIAYTIAAGGTVAVSNIDPAADGAQLAIFTGNPVGDGVSFYGGPWQLQDVDTVALNAVSITGLQARGGVTPASGMNIPVRLAGVIATTGQLTGTYEEIVTLP